MAKVKGSAIKASLVYLHDHLDETGFSRVMDELEPGLKELFEGPILLSNWYEFNALTELMKHAASYPTGFTDRSIAWEMGRFSAEYGLKSIYRIFFRVADPGYIIRKASQVFAGYYSSGAMEVEKSQKGLAVLRLSDFDEPNELFCDRVRGWMERTLELCGAKNCTVGHPKCMARGDTHCEYVGRWE